MNILFLNQFFWPDSAPTAQLLSDLARSLAEQGHQVTVICGTSAYGQTETKEAPPPVRVIRVPAPAFARWRAGKILSYVTFYAGALLCALRAPRPGLVVCLTTPPFLSAIGLLIRKLRGARCYLWEMDLYPEVAIDVGFLKQRSLPSRFLTALAGYLRRHADGVIVLGACMRDRLIAAAVPPSKIHVAENWAESAGLSPAGQPPRRSPHHDHAPHDSPHRSLEIFYSGNLGLAHDVDTIRDAMLGLRGDDRFHFRFGGGGARRGPLEQFCRENRITAASFQPYVDRSTLARDLSRADIGLVTQSSCCVGSIVPSKVYGLMAAGRPILFVGPRDATPARIIRQFDCGWQIDCGDVKSLRDLLCSLAVHRDAIQAAGARARQAFLEHYDLSIGVARIASILSLDSAVRRPQSAAAGHPPPASGHQPSAACPQPPATR